MNIFLTGATGYIAQRLLPVLLEQGHLVFCVVRNSSRFDKSKFGHQSQLKSAQNFSQAINATAARQIIFLSDIVNSSDLSKHLASRKKVEQILGKGRIPLTTLRAGIIVGSGSASFEIVQDLIEKLPVMIATKWLHTKCQPIAIRNVIEFLNHYGWRLDIKDIFEN